MNPTWCPQCCTRHGPKGTCPGPLLATGDERAGWRVTVEARGGLDAIGVLVAPCGTRWRARILTYPNVLWTIPGGGGAMKFAAASPQDAERQAIAFIKAHCIERGWLRRDEVVPVTLGAFADERAPDAVAPSPARRRLRTFPIWFGPLVPTIEAVTANLSATGLFINSHNLLDAGTQIRMRLDLYTFRVALRGQIVWSRDTSIVGRPAGFGVRLVDPPAMYAKFVETLR